MVSGDSDRAVPYDENGALLEKYYKQCGLPMLDIIDTPIGIRTFLEGHFNRCFYFSLILHNIRLQKCRISFCIVKK